MEQIDTNLRPESCADVVADAGLLRLGYYGRALQIFHQETNSVSCLVNPGQ